MIGKAGDDVIRGDESSGVTMALHIQTSLTNAADPTAIEITIGNMPADSKLSAGVQNADGSWTLSLADLNGLTITTPSTTDFTLKVEAHATDGSGLSQSADLNVHVQLGLGDTLVGGAGSDKLIGSMDDDMIYGGGIPKAVYDPNYVAKESDNDVIHAGAGNDHAWGGAGNDAVSGDAGNDTLFGGSGSDLLDGGIGNNELHGGSGDDTLVASLGANVYDGGSGSDTLDFSRLDGNLVFDASKNSVTMTDASGAIIASGTTKSIEGVIGSSGDDSFTGTTHDDLFVGGKGDDWFRGKDGADTMSGGAGSDTFVWIKKDLAGGSVDHITDFQVGEDHFDFSDFVKGSGFKGMTVDDLVHATDTADGTLIQALVKGAWTDVVMLDNVHIDDVQLHEAADTSTAIDIGGLG